ncbi:hypothetical protein XA68_18054 [Ophiocordyceps unilateralis]|uniref:BZIP domain-containing protein n=1 Tax=Ophiocordyceps unilateralis TaxID=268505 RepID=A0A2A9PJF5_OPHUN|nr:hypothetical protein XA68_18054 [Ophiocordyceps unilateralis]
MAGPSLATPSQPPSLASSPPLFSIADSGRASVELKDGQLASRAPLPNNQPRQPRSAVAPTPLPRLCLPPVDKMAMSAVMATDPAPEAPKMSMTSKEWIIPPRPKPGRKPATDTPPTKRKAQNRAAQRAFRERRAARVCELEQQLDEQRETHEKHDAEIKEKMHDLELDLQSFRSRCLLLENMLERERQERVRAEAQAEALRRQAGGAFSRPPVIAGPPLHQTPLQQHGRDGEPLVATDARQVPSQSSGKTLSISHIITPPDALVDSDRGRHAQHEEADMALTCGNCSVNGPCACAEEVLASVASGCGRCGFGMSCQCLQDMSSALGLKRAPSPSSPASDGKRHQSGAGAMSDLFSVPPRPASGQTLQSTYPMAPADSQMPSSDLMPLKDRCGFCKEGTYCLCAEEAAQARATETGTGTPTETPMVETLPPPLSQQTETPPPSEPDVVPLVMEMTADGAVKLPPRRNTQGEKPMVASGSVGAGGPGTCAQCRADPKSGLFCRLMAARLDREQGGCCGGRGAGGGCCKAGPAREKITLPSLPSLGLSCAEAYQTLSSHRNFDRAADDMGSWLPKLKAAAPGRGGDSQHRGRHAIEVEAASIMSVLKEFDVRFGRDC